MASKFDMETNNQLEDEYCDQDDDDLGDFIVYSDDDDELSKHKHQRQEELEDDMEEEVEEEVEPVEEEEEEEAPVGQQEILSLREQLKEEIRRKNAAMAVGTSKARCSSVNRTIFPPAKDGYGTFFGPSKPVLARRVIEEGCSSFMKERKNVSSRKCAQLVSKVQPGTVENLQKPKFVSEEKRKVDALRENRDYSSLFSDDADTAQPTKEQSDNRTALVPKSESHVHGGVMHSAGMGTPSSGQPARLSSKYNASFQARVHGNAGSLGKDSLARRKRMIAAGTNGSNLPNIKKTPGLNPSSNNRKMQPSVQSKKQQQPASQGQRVQQQLQSPRLQGNGHRLSLKGRPDGSVQRQRIGQNGLAQIHGGLKSEKKRLDPGSKLMVPRPMDRRAVKRKSDDGGGKYSLMIRKIFKYDPNKFEPEDDDSDMETDFAGIEKEERRSAALARKEDQEQQLLIEEEERRERMMKKKKLAHKEK
ncbi:histone H3.v1-like [Panicum virgatum]|uniref:SPT2 chromatin protein n=1 Tax=Panicum virgatum TaxID=38727 RepID=A0A8T0X0A1_PANVG|nr:histone H3.v1-like [Panicum virgatum]KAG2652885.1 hypothetical protein PVAP13_1NG391300 [Panicum virgatum]